MTLAPQQQLGVCFRLSPEWFMLLGFTVYFAYVVSCWTPTAFGHPVGHAPHMAKPAVRGLLVHTSTDVWSHFQVQLPSQWSGFYGWYGDGMERIRSPLQWSASIALMALTVVKKGKKCPRDTLGDQEEGRGGKQSHLPSQEKIPLQHSLSKPKDQATKKNLASEIRIFVCLSFCFSLVSLALPEALRDISAGAEHVRSAVANNSPGCAREIQADASQNV